MLTHLPESGNVIPMNKTVPAPLQVAEEMPRELTKAVKVKIITSIDEHWNAARGGYLGDMTDAELARLLKVPRRWVEITREELFGTIRDNEAIQELLDKIVDLERKNSTVEHAIERCMDEFSKQKNEINQLRKEADMISKKVA